MSALSVTAPFAVFTDIDGSPLDSGYIYVGTVNLDPVANPVTVYWDSALSIPATQPIRTINGYPARNGSAANIFIDGSSYSIKVLNRNAQLCFSMANGAHVFNQTDQIPASQVDYTPPGAGATVRTLQERGQDTVSVKDFGAVGDGVTDDSAAINAAIYYVYKEKNGGNLFFPAGVYYIESAIYARSGVNWVGETNPGYFAADARATSIKRAPALSVMVYHAGNLYEIRNIEFEGNNGDASGTRVSIFEKPPAGIPLPADDPLRPGITTYQPGSGLFLWECTLSNAWYAIYNSSNFGAVNMNNCTVRQFQTGIVNTSDSRYVDNLFVGCTFAGMSQNVGGILIKGGLFEFNRKNTDEGAHGIFIQNNASEIMIEGVRFDRNAGHDVYITAGTKRPHTISMVSCHFMRAAWGTNITVRASVYLNGADDITIVGNTFHAASSFPSTVQGLISPRSAVSHSNCTGLILRDNQIDKLARYINLYYATPSIFNFNLFPVWEQSSSGTGEWYLTSTHDADGNPQISNPSYVTNDGVLLTGGTAGSLSVGQWDWADNDSLGFSTVYTRVAGDGDPGDETPEAIYDIDPYVSQLNNTSFPTRSTNIQTDDFTDVYRSNEIPARTLVTNNATAEILSNVLKITVADGHGIVAGDWVYVNDATGMTVTAAAYQVSSVTDAGGGNDYINIDYTAANDTGTVDIYTVTAETFVLRTRRRCMYAAGGSDMGSMTSSLHVCIHGISPAYRVNSDWPFTVERQNTTTVLCLNGTIITHNSNVSHNWFDTSSNNNISIDITPDILGDKLTIRVINTTSGDVAFLIGIKR